MAWFKPEHQHEWIEPPPPYFDEEDRWRSSSYFCLCGTSMFIGGDTGEALARLRRADAIARGLADPFAREAQP